MPSINKEPQYGVLAFRNTGLDDAGHVAFSRRFGELDDVSPYTKAGKKHRLPFEELFDVSNLLEDGSVAPLDSHRAAMNKVLRCPVPCQIGILMRSRQGNSFFHVDSSFNPRRAGYSLLRAHELPPKGTGGNTEYADSRSAFDDLPQELKKELLENDYVVCHSLYHSRKLASPEALPGVNPEDHFMSRHKLIQRHEPSGRLNLYIASHAHHVEGVSAEKSKELLSALYQHACQPKYVVSIDWQNNNDLILWDNTCVMHRATGGSFEGKYKRDMRRTTVHDGSIHAWGLNEQTTERMGSVNAMDNRFRS